MNPRHEKVNRHWTPDQIKLVRNRETFWGNLLAFINFNVILSETNNGFYVDIAIKENGKYLVQISGNNLSTGFQFSSLQTISDDIRESRAQKIRDFQSQRDSKRKIRKNLSKKSSASSWLKHSKLIDFSGGGSI